MIVVLTFILLLALLVLIHEFGHFLAAKKAGIKVEEFGFGFPPRLFGIRRRGTLYSFNLIPIGGFVKLKGEEGGSKDDPESFSHKSIGQRFLVLTSGVGMNYLLATLLLVIGFGIGIPQAISQEIPGSRIRDEKIQILSILKDSPAEHAQFEMGDTILAIDGQSFRTIEELQSYTNDRLGQKIRVALGRGRQTLDRELTLASVDETGKGKMGVGLVKTGIVAYPLPRAIIEGVKTSFFLVEQMFVAFINLIKNLLTTQTITAELTGPVGIAVITGKVVNLGWIYILQFAAILSINLAIINLLPFPALDGGRVFFLLIEKIRGRTVNQRIESVVHRIGFLLLMTFVVVITFRDVARFRENILGFMAQLFGR